MASYGPSDNPLAAENAGLRELLAQAGIDAARLLAEAGIHEAENEAAKKLQRLLLEELHHRVKNTLSTVIAITSQSLRNAHSLEDGSTAVEFRLVALGRAHDLLLQSQTTGASLIDIIHAAIEPFDRNEDSRFTITGEPLEVGAAAVLSLSMSFNELCTNAVKHGALSNKTGRIEIASVVEGTPPRLKLTWTESGGPETSEPTRRSFGTKLIGRLASELHGTVTMTYAPGGLVYRLDMPQEALKALPVPAAA
jgi:two-component sensor histidine kinase